jgi:hypothetical protein
MSKIEQSKAEIAAARHWEYKPKPRFFNGSDCVDCGEPFMGCICEEKILTSNSDVIFRRVNQQADSTRGA